MKVKCNLTDYLTELIILKKVIYQKLKERFRSWKFDTKSNQMNFRQPKILLK